MSELREPVKRETTWTFLTNHTHVLICLVRDPYATMREVSDQVGITERATQKIVKDLSEAGVLSIHKDGRRNRYDFDFDKFLRHPLESGSTLRELLTVMVGTVPVRFS